MKIIAVGLFAAFGVSSVMAQPGVLRPIDGTALAQAKLPKPVREQTERELLDGVTARYDREDLKASTKVLRVRLGTDMKWGWWVVGGHQLCGRGANCPFWIFDGQTGTVLLRSEAGYDFRFLRTTHAGMYDVRILQSQGAVDSPIAYGYEFDGKQYVKWKATKQQLGP